MISMPSHGSVPREARPDEIPAHIREMADAIRDAESKVEAEVNSEQDVKSTVARAASWSFASWMVATALRSFANLAIATTTWNLWGRHALGVERPLKIREAWAIALAVEAAGDRFGRGFVYAKNRSEGTKKLFGIMAAARKIVSQQPADPSETMREQVREELKRRGLIR